MSKNKQPNQKTGAASYIINFQTSVEELNHNYVLYENLLIELQHKYPDDSQDKIQEQESQILSQAAQQTRYSAIQTYIKYQSIYAALEKTADTKLSKTILKIKQTFIFNRSDIEEYVILMNKVLLTDIIKTLLDNSEAYLTEVYNDSQQRDNNIPPQS